MPPTAAEAATAKTPLGSDLAAGIDALSLDQEVTFTKYRRLVLPQDGYVFWVNAAAILGASSALYGKGQPGRSLFNAMPKTITQPTTMTVKGSLHFAAETRQDQDEIYAANRVVFTAEDGVNDLNAIAPGELWIGNVRTLTSATSGPIDTDNFPRFAFSAHDSRYFQAGLWHYTGFAVYPDMEPQIVDDLAGFDSTNVVVSNSLPAWLALNSYAPPYGFRAGLTLFPSFLVPLNEVPPFAAVHIEPGTTRALSGAPLLGRDSTHSQLCAETARITLWGTRNFNALDFVDAVYQYSADTEAFGIMNMPTVRDEKRSQAELGTIAMKKTVDFEISYLQTRLRTISRQVIESATVAFFPQANP